MAYAVMPYADYEDACDAVREKTGGTAAIKSGDLGGQIRAIESGASVDTCTVTVNALCGITVATKYEDGAFTPSWLSGSENYPCTDSIDNVVCGSTLVVYSPYSYHATANGAEELYIYGFNDTFQIFKITAAAGGTVTLTSTYDG